MTFSQIDPGLRNLSRGRTPSGKSGYNKKIKQLLEVAGIDRKVAVFFRY